MNHKPLNSDWHGCYDTSLKGLIVPDAFAHPAKMARGLCERIFDHGAARGYWKPGDTIVDPFGGICTTGLIGAYRGYRCITVELEEKFVALGNANIDKNRRHLERLGLPVPAHVQGDSRKLGDVVQAASGSVFSPPFVDSLDAGRVDPAARRELARANGISNAEHVSPIDMERIGKRDQAYGTAPGQIGAMKEGDHTAVVGAITSPPYADSDIKPTALGAGKATRSDGDSAGRNKGDYLYPESGGQIGTLSADTYWAAMAEVYGSLRDVLAVGGAAAIVVKDYVKNKQRVLLCDQTCQLLEAIGFTVVERCRAWLVKEHTTPTLFGDDHTTRTERKSFFRRLAEKNGSPRIDWEEVIWAVRKI